MASGAPANYSGAREHQSHSACQRFLGLPEDRDFQHIYSATDCFTRWGGRLGPAILHRQPPASLDRITQTTNTLMKMNPQLNYRPLFDRAIACLSIAMIAMLGTSCVSINRLREAQ